MPKTFSKKTYQERQEARAASTAAILAIVADCDFETDAFFEFQHGPVSQAATRVTSRTDPAFRFLVLFTWPNTATDPLHSTSRALCPPGCEAKAALVCEAVRVVWAQRQSHAAGETLRQNEVLRQQEDFQQEESQ